MPRSLGRLSEGLLCIPAIESSQLADGPKAAKRIFLPSARNAFGGTTYASEEGGGTGIAKANVEHPELRWESAPQPSISIKNAPETYVMLSFCRLREAVRFIPREPLNHILLAFRRLCIIRRDVPRNRTS